MARRFVMVWISLLMLLAAPMAFAASAGPEVFGIPIEFILFALTLLGVALFHNQTFYVALTGMAAVALYKIARKERTSSVVDVQLEVDSASLCRRE